VRFGSRRVFFPPIRCFRISHVIDAKRIFSYRLLAVANAILTA
jgi:hypothetical protein